jgi:hypothetical protein
VVAFARPDVLVSPDDGATSMLAGLAATSYGFWNNGSITLFDATVPPEYIDRTLPAGREQGPSGLADAGAACPEIRVLGRPRLSRSSIIFGKKTIPSMAVVVRLPDCRSLSALSSLGSGLSHGRAAR